MTMPEIISLGSNCQSKFSIKPLQPRQPAYPFDWIITGDVQDIINVINTRDLSLFTDFASFKISFSHFNHNLDAEHKRLLFAIDQCELKKLILDVNENSTIDLDRMYDEFRELVAKAHKITASNLDLETTAKYLFEITGTVLQKEQISLLHDHQIRIPWAEVREKYERRFERLFEALDSGKTLLFVRLAADKDDDDKLYDCLQKHTQSFYLLVIRAGTRGFVNLCKGYYQYWGKVDPIPPFFQDVLEEFLRLFVTKE